MLEEHDGALDVTRALSYIFCAERPLRVNELLHALAIADRDDTELDRNGISEIADIVNSSNGLIGAENGCVRLVHVTLGEYLAREENRDKLVPQPDAMMARTCLTYLSFDEFKSGSCDDGDSLDQRLDAYPFLDYASRHWGYHVRKHQDDEKTIHLLRGPLQDSGKLDSAIQLQFGLAHR
ncbi:hypothetical protein B0H63DRAFT_528480 [Podospora didyma]|uniref:GPI inositol-deacylase winged helix domain-containing protein n=1 Tax=Podospora didyma TaxID=330526 RepID=A0AAE0K147_9PEZI|nr:hypothetical protein B0H63DRAFT_528480 [Podospora didyma]